VRVPDGKGNVLEIVTDKTKYMIFSEHQNAGRRHHIKKDNISSETVQDFKYLGTNQRLKMLFNKKLRAD